MTESYNESRREFIRDETPNVLELTKGFTPEQREGSNSLKTLEKLAGYILELTND